VLDRDVARALGATDDELDASAAEQAEEVARRAERYRGDRTLDVVVAGLDAVVVDDGIATGVTAEAALRAVRAAGARSVVLAAPVGSPRSLARLAAFADHVVCPVRPEGFAAVGQFYDDFEQTSDDEVLRLLQTAR
jgi:predicted phosphoribosyltransferase